MKQIEDYILVKKIGEGIFDEVYLANKNNSYKLFAIKKIDKNKIQDELVMKNLRNEINILGILRHPNIVNLESVKMTQNNYYIITEYINGGSLYECLQRYIKKYKRPFPEEIIQYLMKQVVDALVFIHDKNIIHRNLKLENIMVNFFSDKDKQDLEMMKSQIKLIGFGLSIQLQPFNNLTTSIVGTPIYMDPVLLEQLLDIQNPQVNSSQNSISYGKEVDIWSLGCICYELYFGKSIFEGQNLNDIVNEVKNHQLIINSKVSSEFFEFLRNMLQYNKFNRLSAKKLKSLPFLTKDVKMFKILQINEKIEKPFELFGIKDSIALYKEKMKKKKGNI